MSTTTTRPSTHRQFNTLREVLAEIAEIDAAVGENWRTELNLAKDRGQLRTYDEASKAISDLIAAKRALRPAKKSTGRVELPKVPDGRYALPKVEDPTDLAFYLVDVNDQTGFVTISLQVSDDFREVPFRNYAGILGRILEQGVQESAILYGKEKGICGRCHKTLTSKWRLQGIGPKCAQKQD